jgi:16S rRNA (cytosine967-C5)-methyltransferase
MARTQVRPTAEGDAARDPREIDPVRFTAFSILLRSATSRRSIEGPLRSSAAALSDRDRRFLWALVHETLRWQARLDAVIAPLLHRPIASLDPPVRILLRLAACQVCVLNQVPDHAIVDEGVRLARRFAPIGSAKLINAVSHRLTADGRARWAHIDTLSSPNRWPAVHSHPSWLVTRWRKRWGDELALASLQWNNRQAPIWLRARPGLQPPDGEAGWVPDTFKTPEGYQPAEDPSFAAGDWTVQDPSETLVCLLPARSEGGFLLDLCAAPGTKSSHLAMRFGAGSVVAADVSRSKIGRLRETLVRTGEAVSIVVADGLASPFRPGSFDGVLVDAPCSALGVLRRRVDARWNVRAEDLRRHGKQQTRLLDAATGLVRPGGWLLYSVCSTEPEETDAVRERFLATHRRFRPMAPELPIPPEILVADGAVRILPGQMDCDGVYACLFTRDEG